jgi:hypothetical protein
VFITVNREALENSRSSEALRAQVRQNIFNHHKFVKRQRSSYYARREKAIANPDKYLSLIFDGADQAAYSLPYFHVHSHSADGYKVGSHLMGAIAHGIGTYAFSFLENIKHGTNVTIEALWRVLSHIKATGRKIPQIIFIQLDNTAKQNKSQFLLAFCALLILFGVATKIFASFLPVGYYNPNNPNKSNS